MKKILLPTDFSETSITAIKHSLNIAKKMGAAVTLVHVQRKREFSDIFSFKKEKVATTLIEDPEIRLKEVIQELKSLHHIDMNYELRSGKIYREVANLAEEGEYSLIIMGTHGISGFEEFWMGSNAYRVVSAAPCPVLTMRKIEDFNGFNKIVLPIDNSPTTRHKVPYTIDFAHAFNSEVHVVAACMDDPDEFVRRIKAYTNQVANFISEKGIKVKQDVLFGDNITNMTIEYAESINADLISIMTEQEVDPSNLVLGPYAQQMVNHSNIPVLTSRPREDLDMPVTGY